MTQNHFQNHIETNLSFLKESKLLIAISGGLDSVVLTHLCHELKLDIALAHCNFKLRGKESDEDETFVTGLANKLNLEVFVESFNTENYAKEHKLSIQMAARELRYNWFSSLAESLEFDYILTAHHADDNLETFLINLTRGTGLKGLTGIPEVNDNIVRPLLPFSREELEAYAKANDLKWREDSSNASDKYLRNKLRHQVIPALKETTPELLQNFNKTLNHLNDTTSIVDDRISELMGQAIEPFDGLQLKFKISEFKKTENPKPYLYEVFNSYGFTEWNDVVNLLDAQSGKQVFSKKWRLVKDREHLILVNLPSEKRESFVINKKENKFQTPIGILFFDEVDALFGKRTNVVFVDRDVLKFPLILRQWEEGDFFYPSGMTSKKKLSKYFKDEKFSLVDKDHTWLLCSGNDIVWVLGSRVDNRFIATEKTSNILKIELY